jgi:tripartite-type tricarboxylate transporter receptor subunit TctC
VSLPETRAALDQQGVEIETGTPDALAARIRVDVIKWRDVIVSAGIKEP